MKLYSKTLLSLALTGLTAAAWAGVYPDLPKAFADGGGALIDNTAYIGLGSAGEQFFSLDLSKQQAQWQTLPDFPAGTRSQPVVAALEGKLYVFGGLQKDAQGVLQLVNDAHVFDPASQTWQRLPTRSPLGLVGAQAFAHQGKIYFVGGSNLSIFNGYFQDYSAAGEDKDKQAAVMKAYFNQPSQDYFFNNQVFSYEPATNQWHNEGITPFAGRAGAAVKIHEGKVYVANGELKPGLRSDSVELGTFDDKGQLAWQSLPVLIAGEGQARQEGLAGAYSGHSHGYYLLGGGANFTGARAQYESGKYYAHEGLTRYYDPNVYALKDGKWQLAGQLPSASGYGVSLNYEDAVILFGGKGDGGEIGSVQRLRFDGKNLNID